ncbi:MAG TPA: SDR family NAD(P)-dependent oxidoreductase [Longimicrobiales bacterium]
MRLHGKSALITGAGSGIGRATARLFAREGARVLLTGRRIEPLRETADLIRGDGFEADVQPADITDDRAVRAAVDLAARRFDRLDILVNNAGLAPAWTPLHETEDAVWDLVLDTNLKGAFRMCRAALPLLMHARGTIVNVASTSALKGSYAVASYSAAKAGLLALTRCIAAEYGPHGVRCNCVVPSWVDTPMTRAFLDDDATRADVARRHALRRVATAADIARAILYLASDDAAFVTGTAHPVDGGMTAL